MPFKHENVVLNGEQEKESISRVRGDKKFLPSESLFVITWQAS